MPAKPLCLLLPGFGESLGRTPYVALRKALLRQGYRVIGVDIRWDRRTLTDWVAQAEATIPKGASQVDLIVGFSFGALISLILATKIPVRKIIAASASPYFREDLKSFPPRLYRSAARFLGKNRREDLKAYSRSMLSALCGKTKVDFIVGERDFPLIPASTRKMKRLIGSSARILIAKDAPHDIGDPVYLKTCVALLTKKEPRKKFRGSIA